MADELFDPRDPAANLTLCHLENEHLRTQLAERDALIRLQAEIRRMQGEQIRRLRARLAELERQRG